MPHPDIRRYLRHGTLPQLRAFEASVRLRGLTRAAEELHMAQPTASVQVRKLCESVGLPLFEQVGRRIRLTPAGERVHAGCLAVFRALGEMERGLAELRGGTSGRLRLSAPPPARAFAVRLLDSFAAHHPAVQASLEVRARPELEAGGAHDLAILVDPPGERELVLQAIVPNPLVVFASGAHPLAARSDIPFARLAEEPILMREPGSGTRLLTLRLFARHGLAPRIRMELGSDEAIREAILAGLGIAILPRHAPGIDPLLARLVCLDAEDFPIEHHWHFAYAPGRPPSPAARALLDFARGQAKRLFRDCLRGPLCQPQAGPAERQDPFLCR